MKHLAFDVSYFCHRGFHSTGNLKYNGIGTGTIQSFLTAIYFHCKKFKVYSPLFAFDSRKNYRKAIFPGYKNRPPANYQEELNRLEIFKQIAIIRKTILPAIGFKNIFLQTGIEADDIMAKLVRDNPHQIIVLTGDEDLLQLVDECSWYSPKIKTLIYEKAFREKYGIAPKDWKIVKALAGCSSDKIPGISGVGEKTVLKYLTGRLGENSVKTKLIEKRQKEMRINNSILVDLPFPKTKSFKIQKNKFSQEGFKEICNQFGLKKLVENTDRWEKVFR